MASASARPLGKLGIRLIAGFKLVKVALLLAAGFGALHFLHRDVADELKRWVGALRLDPGNRYIHRLLGAAGLASDHRLEQIAVGTFIYAAVFLTEGLGLWFEKRWAEWLTVGVTASLLPFEVYELIKRPTAPRALAIPVNVAAVIYLVWRIVRERREGKKGEKKR